MSKATIAAVILTLNEERDLYRALCSLSWCDEILVLDSGSCDNTETIAREYGARFVQHIQPPPFLITEQRNWALQNCNLTSDWVLFLDADEEIGKDLAQILLRLASNSSSTIAYELTPRYWFFGKWLKRTQGYPNWHPRFLKRTSVHFIGGVWESFSSTSNVGKVYTPYEHYAFSKGMDDWLSRHSRYSTWEAESIVAFLRKPSLNAFATTRSLKLRRLSSRLWPIRPILVFLQKYVLQLGFLEGWQALLYALLMFFYQLMIVIKVLYIRGLEPSSNHTSVHQ